MVSLSHNLTLYAHCPLGESLKLPVSVGDGFFQGQPFNDWKKSRENDVRVQVAIVERLNGVITAVGVVVKSIGMLGRR